MTTCPSGKTRYATEQQATNILGRIWRKARPGRRLEPRAYECPTCRGWHLTSKAARGASAASPRVGGGTSGWISDEVMHHSFTGERPASGHGEPTDTKNGEDQLREAEQRGGEHQ